MYYDVIIAGFGGQGVILIGNLLAYAGMKEGYNVTFFPSYGVEMRGGTANCTVIISDEEIGSPIVGIPKSLIIMNKPSMEKFLPRVEKNGVVLYNSSLIDNSVITRDDVELIPVPVNEMAIEAGNPRLANMIMIGAYVEKTKVVDEETLKYSLENVISERNLKYIPDNIKAIDMGIEFIKNYK